MTHQTFIYWFVKTYVMKNDMTLERMIQAHNYFFYDFFVIFPRIMKKVFRLQIRGTTVQILQ
jgi:hypothetical protein